MDVTLAQILSYLFQVQAERDRLREQVAQLEAMLKGLTKANGDLSPASDEPQEPALMTSSREA